MEFETLGYWMFGKGIQYGMLHDMKTYRIFLPFVLSAAIVLPASSADLLDFVWSGGISETSVVVVAKTKDHTGTNPCKLLVYSDTNFTAKVFESSAAVEASSNNNWVVKMTASTGLVANTTYFYRIAVNGVEDDTKTGRFSTCPAEGEAGGNFKIAFANSNNDPDSPVYDWLKVYDPLFFIDTGDFHYRDINVPDETLALTRHQAAYEENLNVTGLAANQADFYRHVAFGYMWDDHDFGPNDAHAKGSNTSRRALPGSQTAVHKVYRQYMPHWPIGLESSTNFPIGMAPIAQAFTVGRVRFILTDIRSQSEQNESTDFDATLLGAEQKVWFKEELLKASGTYPLIVWLTTTPWNGTQATGVLGNKWYQHTGERAEIADFLKDNHIRGFSAIAGDAHSTAIDNGSNTDYATGGGAGFPLIHAAPIGNKVSYKGGPYSEGATASTINQYGGMEVEDRTNELVAVLFGLNGPSSISDLIIADRDNPGNPLKYAFTNSQPLIASLSPADDADYASTINNLVMTFNEPVQKGVGNIFVYTLTNNALVETIAVTSTAVAVAGDEMTINPASDLLELTAYYVTMDEGVITDGTHDFPGIYAPAGVDYKKWNFLTDGLQILTDPSNVSVPEGGTNTFMVRLSEDPATARTVQVARVSGDTNIAVTGGASLIFDSGSWSNNQPVTLSAAQDPDAVNSPALIRCSSSGLLDVDVTATESDDEPVLTIETSTNAIAVPEGSTNTFQIRLDAPPNGTATVQVSRASGDTDITVSGEPSLLFDTGSYSNWQVVTLSAAEDLDFAESSAFIECAVYSSTTTVTATEQENDLGQTLPFEETFETGFPMAGIIGTVDGQHGWTTDGAGAVVQTGTVYGGSQALQLQNVSVSHLFTDAQTNPVITFYAQLLPTAKQPDTNDIANAAAVFWINTNSNAEAYSGATILTNSSVLVGTGSWHQLEFQIDYNAKTWSLDLNGTNLFSDLGFHDTNKTSFSEVRFTEGSKTAYSYLDSISIFLPDGDGDGLLDSWELTYYPSTTNVTWSDPCANGVNIMGEAYIAGLNPTNPASLFVVTSFQPGVSNQVNWQSVSSRTYTVYWSSNLLFGFTPIGSNLTWPAASFTDTQHQDSAEGFYKLEVELLP